MNPTRIIVNHVPKTGGTTFITALANGLALQGMNKSRRVQISDPCQDARTVIDEQPEEVRLINGHYAFRDPSERKPGEFWIATWREPVDAFFSAWDYYRCRRRQMIKLTAHNPLHRIQIQMIRSAASFEEYLAGAESLAFHPFPIGWEPVGSFDFIVFLETMEKDLQTLGARLGLELEMPPPMSWNQSQRTVDREKYAPRVQALMERYQWGGRLI